MADCWRRGEREYFFEANVFKISVMQFTNKNIVKIVGEIFGRIKSLTYLCNVGSRKYCYFDPPAKKFIHLYF